MIKRPETAHGYLKRYMYTLVTRNLQHHTSLGNLGHLLTRILFIVCLSGGEVSRMGGCGDSKWVGCDSLKLSGRVVYSCSSIYLMNGW